MKRHFKSNGNLIIPSKKHKSDDCTNLERVSDMKGNISMEPMECSSSTCNDDGNGSEYSDSFVSAGCSKETHYRKDILTPEIFKPNTGQSLKQFLRDFERYFWYKYDGKERDCTRELAKFLTRQEKEAYLAVGGPSIKIGEMKQSLLRWYRS